MHTDEMEEKCNHLTEQLAQVKQEVAQLQQQLEEAKANDARSTMKLQSFQQVNRSQSALVKGELQKTRRRLAHTQSVAQRLRDQTTWYQAQAPGLVLPDHLHGMPSEEDAAEEHAELVQLHERWERDVAQMAAELQAPIAAAARAAPGAASSAELEEAKKRIEQLEQLAKKQRKQLEQQGQQAPAPAAAVAAEVPHGEQAAAGAEEAAGLRKELEAAEEKTKEQVKKLKQLAQAYKKLDSEKSDIEAKLKTLQETPQAPTRQPISAEVLGKVRSALAAGRKSAAETRALVASELQQQLPQVLAQALQSKAADLQRMVEDGSKEWRDKYNVECDKRRKLHNLVQELKGNIRVYARVRPMTAVESEAGSCLSFVGPDEIQIKNEDMGVKKTFQFNEVLRPEASQADLFTNIRDLVVSMIDGFNVCMFAYGQTGSGKTHSMQGTKDNPGVYMRTFKELFKVAAERATWKIELKGACVEVYNEELRDLLNTNTKQKLQVRQEKGGGNHVPGLTLLPVTSPDEVDALLTTAQENRTVAATDMNLHSSRSHLVVQILGCMTNPEGKQFNSAITLVDLAGSERIAKSGVSGDRAKEAIAINKSLSALGDVIASRASKSAHTPYRNSILTHFLQDSLGGDSKTLMLLQLNPCASHVEESMCSLNFGARVNSVEMKK
eukprot:TRINITY_DN18296_c0_g1_i1.p1 TRINITY_DN18296_c0_g1~~TRINITY_DN18296_c0_g1_i1.p1  ORF type:complete len:774 (-),score=233.52 TRINITY_DN18296_c0_g1_i1:91-2094(-)